MLHFLLDVLDTMDYSPWSIFGWPYLGVYTMYCSPWCTLHWPYSAVDTMDYTIEQIIFVYIKFRGSSESASQQNFRGYIFEDEREQNISRINIFEVQKLNYPQNPQKFLSSKIICPTVVHGPLFGSPWSTFR